MHLPQNFVSIKFFMAIVNQLDEKLAVTFEFNEPKFIIFEHFIRGYSAGTDSTLPCLHITYVYMRICVQNFRSRDLQKKKNLWSLQQISFT